MQRDRPELVSQIVRWVSIRNLSLMLFAASFFRFALFFSLFNLLLETCCISTETRPSSHARARERVEIAGIRNIKIYAALLCCFCCFALDEAFGCC